MAPSFLEGCFYERNDERIRMYQIRSSQSKIVSGQKQNLWYQINCHKILLGELIKTSKSSKIKSNSLPRTHVGRVASGNKRHQQKRSS